MGRNRNDRRPSKRSGNRNSRFSSGDKRNSGGRDRNTRNREGGFGDRREGRYEQNQSWGDRSHSSRRYSNERENRYDSGGSRRRSEGDYEHGGRRNSRGGDYRRTDERGESRNSGRYENKRSYGGRPERNSRSSVGGFGDRKENREGGYGSKSGRGRTFNRDRSKNYSRRDSGSETKEKKFGSGFGAGFDRSKFIKKAREKTTEVLRSRDMYLAYLSNCIDEEERVANQLVERLEEIYGLYFPELRIDDRRNYALIISKITRDNVDIEAISKYVGEGKARQIADDGKNSIGGDFTEKDVLNMQKLADEIEAIYALMNRHEKYLDDVCGEVCPNLRYLVGAKLSGKLISGAGGLQKLAVMPASTVQVLGAEKALFKHLKNKSIAPPKHGFIFQHASISTSPKSVRGKIARALASKIALVVKADAYTKRFIAPEIKEKFEKRFADIMRKDVAARGKR